MGTDKQKNNILKINSPAHKSLNLTWEDSDSWSTSSSHWVLWYVFPLADQDAVVRHCGCIQEVVIHNWNIKKNKSVWIFSLNFVIYDGLYNCPKTMKQISMHNKFCMWVSFSLLMNNNVSINVDHREDNF